MHRRVPSTHSERDRVALQDLETCFAWMKNIPERRQETVDVILALGNAAAQHTAELAATLYQGDIAPLIVCCGGRGRTTRDSPKTEAVMMAEVLRQRAVPERAILIEETSSNTLENLTRSFALLEKYALPRQSICLVHDSGTPRRDRNMLWRYFPEYRTGTGSHRAICWTWGEHFLDVALCGAFGTSFDEYAQMFTGTMQRVIECACPERPWHIPDTPPETVLESYRRLRSRYTTQLIF